MPGPARLPWWRRWFGSRSERAAARFLRKLGHRILIRNYTCPLGEIDVIALDQATIVFVEVRSTERTDTAARAESVDAVKQQRLTRLALYFLKEKRLLGSPARFDVLTVSWPKNARIPQIHHFKNAFDATGMYSF